jgi:type II secretory pathway component PulF
MLSGVLKQFIGRLDKGYAPSVHGWGGKSKLQQEASRMIQSNTWQIPIHSHFTACFVGVRFAHPSLFALQSGVGLNELLCLACETVEKKRWRTEILSVS